MIRDYFKQKTLPLPHQLEAINFLVSKDYAALFDEQGVGKTKEIIDAIITILKAKKADSALIICPKTLLYTWQMEVKKHSYLVPVVIEGASRSKGYKFLTSANIYILNYEGVKSELDIVELLLESQRFILVLDESQRIKNPQSQTFDAIARLSKYPVRKYILSGTPVANKPVDIWAQFYFLDGGKTLGKDYKLFQSRYGDITKGSLDSYKKLKEKIAPLSIRRLKENVLELPEKIYEQVLVDMSNEQNQIYQKLKKELLIEIINTPEKKIIDEAKSILKKLLRLAQIASNPGLIVMDYKETPAKFIALDKIVKDIISRGEKVIIWSSFVDNVKQLKQRYQKYGALNIYGGVEMARRNKYINQFQEDKDCKILVANPAAAREGLTLTAANNAVYLDRSFNLVDYLQSQDRIHRISQKRQCRIIKLLCKGSIDFFIEDKLARKQDIAKVIQGDSIHIDDSVYLTKEEIVELLS
jgi:SNF2 family DNA or RNA helicase